ncbi:type II secretion system F family protein [Zafaria sp. J156]|uniref:type II secretion system F family protein n=1 Tax=Zafaria sp. J156 TaxID=3116490 RepID=UPI002E7A63B6|nr:hypothetical protein [Zafaria sp. J156]
MDGLIPAAAVAAAAAAWLVQSRPARPGRAFGVGRSPTGWRARRPSPLTGTGSPRSVAPGMSRPIPWGRRREDDHGESHTRAVRQGAALLRSGRTASQMWELMEQAWRRADGPAAEDILAACRSATAAHRLGLAPSTGLRRHLVACDDGYRPVWERLAWCVDLSEGTGVALSELLDRLAGQLEGAGDSRRARETALAGPATTQRLLAWLPAFGLVLAQLIGADPIGVLLTHPIGRLGLLAGVALWWANRVWGRRLLAAAERPGAAP